MLHYYLLNKICIPHFCKRNCIFNINVWSYYDKIACCNDIQNNKAMTSYYYCDISIILV